MFGRERVAAFDKWFERKFTHDRHVLTGREIWYWAKGSYAPAYLYLMHAEFGAFTVIARAARGAQGVDESNAKYLGERHFGSFGCPLNIHFGARPFASPKRWDAAACEWQHAGGEKVKKFRKVYRMGGSVITPKKMPTGDPECIDTGGSFPTFTFPDCPYKLESTSTDWEKRHERVRIIKPHGCPVMVQFANGRDRMMELTWDDYVRQFGVTPRATVA